MGQLIQFPLQTEVIRDNNDDDNEFLFDSFISKLSPTCLLTLSQMTPEQIDLVMLAQQTGYFRGYDDGVGE